VRDVPGTLSPTGSVIQTTRGTDGGTSTTVSDDPVLADPYDVSVNVLASRSYPAFRQAVIVSELLPPTLLGDYHLAGATSPARGRGLSSTTVRWGPGLLGFTYAVTAPRVDIDGQTRPSGTPARYDAGSDQLVP
jgi:hypothetical protein